MSPSEQILLVDSHAYLPPAEFKVNQVSLHILALGLRGMQPLRTCTDKWQTLQHAARVEGSCSAMHDSDHWGAGGCRAWRG